MNELVTKGYIIFIFHFILVSAYGYRIYRKRKSREHDSKAFFVAGSSLTWRDYWSSSKNKIKKIQNFKF